MSTELEPRLHAWLVAQAPADVPVDLAARVTAIPGRVPVRWTDRLRAAAGARAGATPPVRTARLALALALLLALVVAAVALVGALPSPPRTYLGEFVPTGSMLTPRLDHTATLLADGRVLVTGGSDSIDGPALASAEIYDPGTGSFSPTGQMTEARTGHSALRLPDGQVLVGGGLQGTGFDLYDPATGTFRPTAIAPRMGLTVLLADGRVLIANGDGGASLWDPATGIETPSKGGSGSFGALHVAMLLPDGKVLITGRVSMATDSASIYDPITDEFRALELPAGLTADVALKLDDGRVFLLRQGQGFVFDPAAETFGRTTPGRAADGPGGYVAARLADGRVLILADFVETATEYYDPIADTRTPAGDLLVPRRRPAATLLDDGRVLVTGGSVPASSRAYSSAELFQ